MAKSDKKVEKHVTCKSMIQSYDTITNTMKAGVDAKIYQNKLLSWENKFCQSIFKNKCLNSTMRTLTLSKIVSKISTKKNNFVFLNQIHVSHAILSLNHKTTAPAHFPVQLINDYN